MIEEVFLFVIVSVLFLIGLFLCIAAYLILTGLNFIGLSYLLVYIGAVTKRINKYAALVRIQLYKVLLIINDFLKLCYTKMNFLYLSSFFSSSSTPLTFATQGRLNSSQKSLHTIGEQEDFNKSNISEEFIKWFVGFSDAESNFMIVLYRDKTNKISSITFRFTIELHVDDMDALKTIKSKLNIGNDIAVYGSSCKFTVTHPKDIYTLFDIFDKYNLNTTKYLDYLDFKKAFCLYQERDKTKKEKEILIDKIIELKNGMNKIRDYVNLPVDHKIVISGPWLLGFIEGEGSFCLLRSEFDTLFQVVQSETQLPVMQKIKEFLETNLGFDKYSMFKLKSSSAIILRIDKSSKNCTPQVVLAIKNTNILVNYLIPYLENMPFITKKGKDFYDFKILSTAIYNGIHRRKEIISLILELSYSMNKYRLTTNTDSNKTIGLSNESLDTIIKAKPTIRHLEDGRQLDLVTGKPVNRRWTNCIYEIVKDSGETVWASTLNDAAEILGVEFRTVTKHLQSEDLMGQWAEIKGHRVRRISVFYP